MQKRGNKNIKQNVRQKESNEHKKMKNGMLLADKHEIIDRLTLVYQNF